MCVSIENSNSCVDTISILSGQHTQCCWVNSQTNYFINALEQCQEQKKTTTLIIVY